MKRIIDFLQHRGVEFIENYNHITLPTKKINIQVWDISSTVEYTEAEMKKHIALMTENEHDYILFYSDELDNKFGLVESMLKSKLGIKMSKTYRASDLTIKEIKKVSDYTHFFNKNHIDGYVQSSYAYGLFDKDDLISIMSFRYNKDHACMEIARFCSKLDTMVYGGFSKLISYFPKDQALISYSNTRFSTGNVYEKNRFERIESSDSLSYYYTNGKERIYRTRCQKRLLPEEIRKLNLTEKQYAEQGYFGEVIFGKKERLYRVYGCGQMKWILRKEFSNDNTEYYIYKYTINGGKSYIGYTDDIYRRNIQHRNDPESPVYQMIKTYGENVIFEVLETVIGLSTVKKREIELIKQFNTYFDGYNRTHGGDGACVTKKLTPDDVKKIVEQLNENKLTMQEIANNFKVSETTIRSIYHGRIWKNHSKGKLKRKKLVSIGSNQGNSILTEEDIKSIKIDIMNGKTRAELAKKFNVKSTTIEAIAAERNWGHIKVEGYNPEKYKSSSFTNILTEDIVRNIKLDLKSGLTNANVARKYNVSKTTIGHIANGKSWKNVLI